MRRATLVALVLVPGVAGAWTTDAPPSALPEGTSFGPHGVSFGSHGLSFGATGLSSETMALAADEETSAGGEPATSVEAEAGPETSAEGEVTPAMVTEATLSVLRSDAPPDVLPAGTNFSTHGVDFAAHEIAFADHGISFGAITPSAEVLVLMAPPAPASETLAEGLEVTEEAGGVRYTLAADILFDFDSAALRPAAQEALTVLSDDVQRRFGAPVIVVEGHTDSKGSDVYNQALSEQRATSVAEFLTEAQDFSPASIETTGLGESQPAAANETPDGLDDPEGRQLNRRVEILVRPAT